MSNSRKLLAMTVPILVLVAWFAYPLLPAIAKQDSASVNSIQPLSINYVISEPCGLVCFVDTISRRAHTTSWVRDWYEGKQHLDSSHLKSSPDEEDLLASYKELLDRESSQDLFKDPTGRQLSLDDKLIALSAQSSELPGFLAQLKDVVKAEDYLVLEKTYTHFAGPYRQLLWEPRLARLQEQLSEFQHQSVECKMAERLAAVQKFMKAPWVLNLPFTIVLVPLPAPTKKPHTHGQSLGAVQTVEMLPTSKFNKSADVVFHEACHALWFSKPDYAAEDAKFQLHDYGRLPLTELYEGMATGLGQGWFAREALGQSPHNWYGDETINRYAHAVAPLYASYLKHGETIDDAFAQQATRIYFKQFPHAARTVQLTSEYAVFSAQEIPDLQQFKQELMHALPRLRELNCYSPIDDPHVIDGFHHTSAENVAIFLPRSEISKLTALGLSSSQSEALRRCMQSAISCKIGTRTVLLCIADSFNDQRQLLFDALRKTRWTLPRF